MVIVGDLNARIGKEQGTVDTEAKRRLAIDRRSEDCTKNTEGHKLLKVCEWYGLVVLNDWLKGDEEGKLTYIGGGGSSVLHLIILKEDGNDNIIDIITPRVICQSRSH